MKIEWTLEKRKINDLIPHKKNPRSFTKKGMIDLEKSIKSVGFMQPVNINQNNTILSGHARVLKLKEMGNAEIDVYVPNKLLTKEQEEEILIRANANTAGEWDWDLLANEWDFKDLDNWGLNVPVIDNQEEKEDKEDKDLSDDFKSKYILEIECESEAKQEILYNRFLNEKLKVKILSI